AVYAQGANNPVVLKHRDDKNRTSTGKIGHRGKLRITRFVAGGLLDIGNMDDLLRRNGLARTCLWMKGVWAALPEFGERGRGVFHGGGAKHPAVVEKQMREFRLADALGVREDRLEHGGQFAGRTRNDLENL